MDSGKKKLLIYAHYYAPDVASTGQILKELAEGLVEEFKITVICAVPSYSGKIDSKYRKQKYYKENMNGVQLLRVRVPEFQKRNKISRIKNIIAYFMRSMIATFKAGKQDYVLAVSQPPVLGGLLGVWGKWVKGAKYIYQIQDFNPEQIIAVNFFNFKPLLWLLMKLDKFNCYQADEVITVGRDLVQTLKCRFARKPSKVSVSMINNWVDEKETYPLASNDPGVCAFKEKYGLKDKYVITYNGNLGHYYDLMNLLKVIEKFKPGTRTNPTESYPKGQEVIFAFVGGGSLQSYMIEYCKINDMNNVIFIPYQDKKDLIYALNAGDVHWCVNAKGIKGVSCPSKYYGIAAVAKPIIAVLEKGSEIGCIIEETKGGLLCEPGEYEKVEANLRWFIENAHSGEIDEMGKRSHEYLKKYLRKEISIRRYAEAIMQL
ncbi:MAG: glycosyltransferase family 4 protein [Lachnospiraceae bacterium]|nr:glycosyltransferase family 4 protein [Lachnospiraceae bacterium]